MGNRTHAMGEELKTQRTRPAERSRVPDVSPRARFKEAGICLLEVMIAMAAGAVVLSATIQTLHHFDERLRAQHRTIARQQDLRLGLAILEAEVRLAGTASLPSGNGLLKAERQEVEFTANLEGLSTTLIGQAAPGERELRVENGSDWRRGKRVVVCAEERCADGRLAAGGRRDALFLNYSLGQSFPTASPVVLCNQVRYYLGRDQWGHPSLMREVDQGANTLIEGVTTFQLAYLDGEGKPTADLSRITRVRIHVAVGKDQPVTKEIGLRTR